MRKKERAKVILMTYVLNNGIKQSLNELGFDVIALPKNIFIVTDLNANSKNYLMRTNYKQDVDGETLIGNNDLREISFTIESKLNYVEYAIIKRISIENVRNRKRIEISCEQDGIYIKVNHQDIAVEKVIIRLPSMGTSEIRVKNKKTFKIQLYNPEMNEFYSKLQMIINANPEILIMLKHYEQIFPNIETSLRLIEENHKKRNLVKAKFTLV